VDWYKFRGAGLNTRYTVPTTEFRNGDFSQLRGPLQSYL
jgi:hypothetical protein